MHFWLTFERLPLWGWPFLMMENKPIGITGIGGVFFKAVN